MVVFNSNPFTKANVHSATVCPFTLLGNNFIIIKYNYTEGVEMFEIVFMQQYNNLKVY